DPNTTRRQTSPNAGRRSAGLPRASVVWFGPTRQLRDSARGQPVGRTCRHESVRAGSFDKWRQLAVNKCSNGLRRQTRTEVRVWRRKMVGRTEDKSPVPARLGETAADFRAGLCRRGRSEKPLATRNFFVFEAPLI